MYDDIIETVNTWNKHIIPKKADRNSNKRRYQIIYRYNPRMLQYFYGYYAALFNRIKFFINIKFLKNY